MCRHEMGVPRENESLQFTIELEAGCADRRCMCRQDVRAFSLLMNCRLGVPTGEGCADRR